jgi:predicted ATPase
MPPESPAAPPFINRVRLRHYKSIGSCDVTLGRLTFLVGPNGAGKSNFLDALRLVSDALRTASLDHALRDRGGINEVRRRSAGHPRNFAIRLDFTLRDSTTGHFAFEVGARARGEFFIKSEECVAGKARYLVREGQIVDSPPVAPPAAADRLYLGNAAGLPEFRSVWDELTTMGFYSLNPREIRALQHPDKGDILDREGRNLPSVLERLEKTDVTIKKRIEEYLGKVVPGVEGVEPRRLGHMETLEFRQRVPGAKDPWRFLAINMSDGTLRALGVLVALFQVQAGKPVPFVGIEEPEVALHPAAAGALRDCLREGSDHTQVLVTSHSPELLDDPSIPASSLLAVMADNGESEIAALDDIGRLAMIRHLQTAGDLLRADQLRPDPSAVERARQQMELFDFPTE